jgi:glycosyltransferase involved in cell wall biosynthesis
VDKNRFDLAIEALAELKKQRSDFIWLVIGDGHLKSELSRRASELNLENHIRWLGPVFDEAITPWMMSADIFIHPSAIGLSLMMAMGYALPVITHDNPENQMPEFSAFYADCLGVLYQEGSSHDLCRQISRLADDPQARKQMGESGLALVLNVFNIDAMAENFFRMTELAVRCAAQPENCRVRSKVAAND